MPNNLNCTWGTVNPQGLRPPRQFQVKICSNRDAYKICYMFLKDSSLLFGTGDQPALCTSQMKSQGWPQKTNPLIPPNHWLLFIPFQKKKFVFQQNSRIHEPLLLLLARDDTSPHRSLHSMTFIFHIMLIALFCSLIFLSVHERERWDTVEKKDIVALEKEDLGSCPCSAIYYLWTWVSPLTYMRIIFSICTTRMSAMRIKWNNKAKALCKLYKEKYLLL